MEATLKTINPKDPGQCARCKGTMWTAVWTIDNEIEHEDEFCSKVCADVRIDTLNEATWCRLQAERIR